MQEFIQKAKIIHLSFSVTETDWKVYGTTAR